MLDGKHIKLRAIEPKDADLLYEWENDFELWNVSETIKPFSVHIINKYIENDHFDIFQTKQLRLMIDLSINKKNTIGMVDLFDFDPYNRRAGVGIMIHNKYRTKGYAADTLNVLTKYAFNFLNLHQLHCTISEKNQTSLKLFTNNGFEIVGLQKDWSFNGEEFENVYFLQKIKNYKK